MVNMCYDENMPCYHPQCITLYTHNVSRDGTDTPYQGRRTGSKSGGGGGGGGGGLRPLTACVL